MAPNRLLAALLCAAPFAAGAQVPNLTVVEFFNPVTHHYFLTASAGEAAGIDAGAAGPGWQRTGGRFAAFANASDAPGLSGVCRFYGPGPNSHFYTADANECTIVRNGPGWLYENTSWYVYLPVNGACAAGTQPVYRSYNNGFPRNDSNHRFTVDLTAWVKSAADGYQQEGVVMCAPFAAADHEADAVRLLRQATFGPKEAELNRVLAIGATAWIDEQLAMPATTYPVYPYVAANRPDSCVDVRTPPVTPASFCARDNYTLFPLQLQFFRDAVHAPDQLRQRVAFALSQIFVTSGVDNSRNYAMRHYQQIFRDRAFGNFFDLMSAVTLSPMMGDYLDMANNNRANAATGVDPNENYAREILQLFSVGVYLLNPDGTQQLDAAGKPRFTYDLAEIKGFSRVFTGWTYPTIPGQPARANNPRNYDGAMLAVDAQHEFGTKVLLSGVVSPANLSMAQDLEFAHRNIFNHANVGPFIGKLLIQKLVTSDPSPGYVRRVAAAFDNSGFNTRGDLRAVVRAVLTDPEARGAVKIDPAYGKLTEPVLYMTSILRGLDGATDGVHLRNSSNALGQFLFYAPSVFNYYPPDYIVPGTTLLGPEFGIQTSTTAISRVNFANGLVFTGAIAPDTAVFGATGTQVSLAAYQGLAGDANALAERFNRNLMAGRMSAAMKAAIVSAVNAIPATDTLNRARTAAFLVVGSPQFQVER